MVSHQPNLIFNDFPLITVHFHRALTAHTVANLLYFRPKGVMPSNLYEYSIPVDSDTFNYT